MPRRYNHAIIILYGDGDPQVTVRVTRGSRTVAVNGAEFKVVPAAEEEVNIEFINTDPLSPRRGPTLEIISLDGARSRPDPKAYLFKPQPILRV
jgi:hypothetical protein